MGIPPSGMNVWEARGLSENPLDAATEFAQRHLPVLREGGTPGCHILFDPADHSHDAWRKAMIEELAREAAPGRINAVVGTDVQAIRQVLDYLDNAPGVTGQIFVAV